MPCLAPNYFRYFTPSAELPVWGLALTAAGFTRVAPSSAYPPPCHPADHDFSWAHGRVLESLQIVLISEGRGKLEIRGEKPRTVLAGMAFVLLPHVWHRYRPDATSGWTESWIEVQGPVVERLLAHGVFPLKTAARAGAIAAGLDDALESVHTLARDAAPSFDPELSARAFSVLAAWARSGPEAVAPSHVRGAVLAAERYLVEHQAEPVNIEELARRLGVAYSHFRRAFRVQTGLSPWKFVLHLRLTRARRMLAASDATLEAIATRLGFNTAFHLSVAFKQAYGVSPDRWRRELRAAGKFVRPTKPGRI